MQRFRPVKEGIREVFATIWHDDGAEANLFSTLPSLQLFAEHTYHEKPDTQHIAERFLVCTGGSLESFNRLNGLDTLSGHEHESILEKPANPSKFMLWQDILIGLFDRHIDGIDLDTHYKALSENLKACCEGGEWSFVFKVPYQLSRVLAVKGSLGLKLREAYLRKDSEALAHMAYSVLPDLYHQVERLRQAHREQWFFTYKPFGWEVLDIRYGGLLARIHSAAQRLEDYLNGQIQAIEELEVERLYFDGPDRPEGTTIGRCNQYHRIVSACHP